MEAAYQSQAAKNDLVLLEFTTYWLSVPLTRPYYTSNNPKGRAKLDVLLIRAVDSEGRVGWGEACPSWGGYSPETPERAWSFITDFLPLLIGKDAAARACLIAENFKSYPFLMSAINECTLDLCDDALISPLSEEGWFELAATVNTLDAAEAVQIAKEYVDSGYSTLKVKVGIEAKSDADRVTRIYEAVKGKAKLRVDANRNFSPDAAYEFAVSVPIEAIEYFEQPFSSSNWAATELLATQSPIPLMLDESIYGPDDIKRVAKTGCAKAVKLKMSKVGGPRALKEQVKLAHGLGLNVIVGNGVASDFACYREALCCSRAGVITAGEMNGFLKLVAPILSEPLRMRGARLILPAGAIPKLSEEAISKFSIHQARFS
ncbi:MAG: hypothetical protein KF771_10970 [Burkholderiales bacterium]|nr:hypothetical protein [Burkholderiales bacterium]